ncbi:biotin--[acetyl-CoA-carboxylase] ligase [Kocuria tytonis]|uniref:biotin--[biotin carboxyl-carrier protein] ligase n=1 Tax=Kocuria tytonis TaxID=2054280 RepID=A0A495A481_9MICC|nr:biotin--[acetyl-CoA-carboxylase] ligase [Kocuria tytonis]RKQ34192.1 biotin--[acetyl-CoA-carboxylase] ligase [Kocuria tytonis]
MDVTEQHPAADYDAAELAAALRPLGYREITVLDSVGSTNTWLTDRVAQRTPRDGDGPDLEAVVTGYQSRGKGRLDRQWVTPAGAAVTFSVACTPVDRAGRPWPQELLPWLTLLMAHSITEAVRGLMGAPATIKWPNDVLNRDRKLCGILAGLVPTTGAGPRTVVIGAGINVNQQELPVPTATSLRLEAGPDGYVPARPELLTVVLARFSEVMDRAAQDPAGQLGPDGELRRDIENRLGTLGRRVSLQLPGSAEPLLATATGLGASGQLLVRAADGTEHEYSAGDVVHVRPASPAPGGRGAAEGPRA